MAQIGDKTHTPHGLGTITEIDSVRGRTQYRVAGAGFNVWLDETKVHVANEGGGLFGYGPWAEEAREESLDPNIEHFAGLDATIEPGSTPVNERNHTTLPYNPTPQYHHDVWADDLNIQPGEQEIDADERLHASDSVSGKSQSERPYPGPNPDLFAKSSAYNPEKFYPHGVSGNSPGWGGNIWGQEAGPGDYDDVAHDYMGDHNAEAIHHLDHDPYDAPYIPEGEPHHGSYRRAWKEGDPVDWSGGYPMDPETGEDLSIDPRPRATNPDYLEGGGRVPDPTGKPIPDYEWAPGFTPSEDDIRARSKLKHPESGELSPGESWGGGGGPEQYWNDTGAYQTHFSAVSEQDEPGICSCGKHYVTPDFTHEDWKKWTHQADQDYFTDDPEARFDKRIEGSYRPAGLSDRYAYFDLEAADNDSPVAQFRRDPVGYIEMCGHLWTDGDDSLEKFADYTGLIDIDPTLREAAWSDVRQKAQRLRHEGRVHVNDMGENRIYATVEGDHGTYDTMIAKGGSMGGFGGGQSITNWACSCDWGRWAFKRQMTYVGRLCSHGYATYLTMQSDYTKANPITQNQPYKKKWASRTAGIVEDYKSWLETNDQNPEAASVAAYLAYSGDDDPEDAEKLYDYISDNHAEVPERDHDIDYVTQPEDAYKSAAYSTHSQPHKPHPKGEGYGQQLPDGAFDIADAVSELDEPPGHDLVVPDHATQEQWDEHYRNAPHHSWPKHADLLRTTPRSLTPDLRAVPEGEGEQWVDVTKDDRKTTGPDQIVKDAAAIARWLHGAGEGITDFATAGPGAGFGAPSTPQPSAPSTPATPSAPSGGSSGGGMSGLWDATAVGGTNIDSQIAKGGSRRSATGQEGITDFAGSGPSSGSGSSGGSLPDLGTDIDGKPIPSSGDANRDKATKFVMDNLGENGAASFHTVPHTGSRRFAESSDAALLDKLREMSTTPAADDLGHMDDHNEELRDVVDELQDRGYDASFMVAAVEDDNPNDGKGDFLGRSVADWANEPFAGSGPAPKDWFSDSAGYVDENERPDFIDVTEAPDGDIIKFNDDRSRPQQGPRTSSRRKAEAMPSDPQGPSSSTMTPGTDSMGGAMPDAPDEPFDVSQTLASLHVGSEPGAEDWENASGQPFIEEVKKDVSDATGDGEDSEDGEEGGDGGSGLGSMLPGLMKGLGGGGGAAAGAAGAGAAGASGAELAGLAVLAGNGVRRAGHGARSQVRIDPGARQPNRPRQAMNPPDDFGFEGEPTMDRYAAAEDDNGDDIVAAFQRSAGAAAVMGGGSGGGSDDIADRALAFLRTAGRKYSPAEQRELEAEHHPLGARNLPTEEELSGTHYLMGM